MVEMTSGTAEQHTFIATLSITSTITTFPFHTSPQGLSLVPVKICADLQWVRSKRTQITASAKRRRVWTYFLVHRLEKYMHCLCWHHCVQKQKWNKKGYSATLIHQDCHYSPQCIFWQSSARVGNVFESWIEGSVISAQSSTKIRGVWGTDRSG